MLNRFIALSVCFISMGSTYATAADFPASAKQIKQWTASGKTTPDRALAQTATADESMLSPQFIALRNRYLKIKTAAEMDALLTDLENNLSDAAKNKAMPLDEKLASSMLTLSVPLKSLVYLISDDRFWNGSEISHSAAITFVKSMAANFRLFTGFLDGQSSPERAGFDYVTQPIGTIAQKDRFQNVEALQTYICDPKLAYGKLTRSGGWVQSVLADWNTNSEATFTKNNRWIVWDNQALNSSQIFSGTPQANNPSPAYRYMWFGKAELSLLVANLYGGIAQINMFCSYNAADAINAARQVNLKMGADGAKEMFNVASLGLLAGVNKPEYGLTEKQNVTILKSFPNLMAKRDLSRMGSALKFLTAAKDYSRASLDTLVNTYPDNDRVILSRKKILPYVDDMKKGLSLATDLLEKDEVALASQTDYEHTQITKVSLKKFFNNPPSDLKAFLPNPSDTKSFDNSSYWINESKDAKNYSFGRITRWNNAALENYVIDAKGNPNPDPLIRALKIVSQVWGVESVQ